MLSKLSLSLTAALALSAAAGRVARAAPVPTSTDDAREMAHSPTNDEINAAERGSPDSVDNKDQQAPPTGENWRADWQAEESEDPDSL